MQRLNDPKVRVLVVRVDPGTYESGRIAGARNAPWSQAVNAEGTFKSPAAPRAPYAAAGIDGTQPVIIYCRIGERSRHTGFVLREILSHGTVRQDDGSWTEYGNVGGVPKSNLAGRIWDGK